MGLLIDEFVQQYDAASNGVGRITWFAPVAGQFDHERKPAR
jgi:hypothetical protein